MPYSPRESWYREKLAENDALWTDLYALTMSQALHKTGKHDINTTFEGFVRKLPFGGGYMISAGQNIIAEWLDKNWEFTKRSLDVLANKWSVNPVTGQKERLFTDEFIDMCRNAKCELTIDCMKEGELAFQDEPIYRVRGPVWQCLLVEAAILNAINSQSLFATLASRLKEATKSEQVFMSKKVEDNLLFEFGLRRAQCIGGLEPTRGAYIGGIDATSNMLAEEYYGIWTVGTFAHALVMLYEDELEAFSDYARAMPNNAIFLVDTYNTVEGVKKAIKACQDNNVHLKGIRLDSGDLAYLSKEARKLLDAAGFTDAKIAASNDLDEAEILKLKRQGAKIDIWAVGTNLVTSKAQPALGAVYKLVEVYGDPGLTLDEIDYYQKARQSGDTSPWALEKFIRDVIKLGEKPGPGQQEKASLPGEHLVLRTLFNDEAEGKGWRYDGDIIYPAWKELPVSYVENPDGPYQAVLTAPVTSVDKVNGLRKTFAAGTPVTLPVQRQHTKGELTGTIGTVHTSRDYVKSILPLLAQEHRELVSPHPYGVGLEESLYDKQQSMIRALRNPKP